jgi:hypothetical protein
LNAVVDIVLDVVESQQVLQAPEVKLNALSQQRNDILRSMNVWRRSWYRIRSHPVQSIVVLAVVGILLYRETNFFQVAQPYVQKLMQVVQPYVKGVFHFISLVMGGIANALGKFFGKPPSSSGAWLKQQKKWF